MAWRLPPLNAIRSFEVAARHSSFTKAADELFVTPGAVSRQIRSLEDHLGRPLFDRNYREVNLTAASQAYAQELFDAFAQIDKATRTFAAHTEQRKLKVYAPVTFAMRWLLPRLGSYHALFPDQGVSIASVGKAPVDLDMLDLDVVIRLTGSSPSTIAERLFDVRLVPICSPSFMAQHGLSRIEDLRSLPLLHSTQRRDDWPKWLQMVGIDRDVSAQSVVFESSSLAYEAALGGLGVAMAMQTLVEDDIAAGKFVTPFSQTYSDGTAFHVVYPSTAQTDEAVLGFSSWIREEAAKSIMHAPHPRT
ncbi:transcriptional regulator, LysR family [Rhizobium sp. CF080]|uniref:transcriptional regulator GcvA n=1 Tax=Rhizobium sp. (strain CF080) TaxID=1144310 RepID=UPI000271787E|nr:transcriptional regulator GcvA [Rhizobium sp. CF080]EUB98148.1 transcriptional regulator, LysR family [Rhizobium sp. CF080]